MAVFRLKWLDGRGWQTTTTTQDAKPTVDEQIDAISEWYTQNSSVYPDPNPYDFEHCRTMVRNKCVEVTTE
jgi:hypothetical protein